MTTTTHTTPPTTRFVAEPTWVTVAMAATMCSVSESTIWRWIHASKVISKKIGGRRLIRLSSIHRMFEQSAA
jgi:hypothetical protein